MSPAELLQATVAIYANALTRIERGERATVTMADMGRLEDDSQTIARHALADAAKLRNRANVS